MRFSREKPLVYEQCRQQFGIDWDKGIVLTYGDVIHCKTDLDDHLVIHESVHIAQQTKMGKDAWWAKYFTDPVFRLSQEIEAYREQWQYIQLKYNRHERRKFFHKLASDMASMYGGMCTREQAEELLS